MPYDKKLSTHRYMSPLKLFEYMASRRPIVASDFPVLHEILTHEKNVLFVEPDNSNELVASISRLKNDKSLSHKISERAFIDVKEYTWERRVMKVIDFFEKIIFTEVFHL